MIRRVLLASVAAMLTAAPAVAQGADGALHVGDAFPALAGTVISGRAVTVPAAGRPAVVVMAFSRAAGDDARKWNEWLAPDSANVDVVVVAELESVPRLLRGAIGYTIRRGVPQSLRDRMLLLYRDEAVWKRRLGVSADEKAYVTFIDGAGQIRWMSGGVSDDATREALRALLARGGPARHL